MEGDAIQVPSALSPEEPRQERGAVRRHQGAILAGSLLAMGPQASHATPQSPLSPPGTRIESQLCRARKGMEWNESYSRSDQEDKHLT